MYTTQRRQRNMKKKRIIFARKKTGKFDGLFDCLYKV